jgi:hypothetical protein
MSTRRRRSGCWKTTSKKGACKEMATDPVEIIRQRNAKVEEIRGYVNLTPEAKERRIAGVHERAQAAYSEAIEADKRERERRLEQTKQAVFRIPPRHYPRGGSTNPRCLPRGLQRHTVRDRPLYRSRSGLHPARAREVPGTGRAHRRQDAGNGGLPHSHRPRHPGRSRYLPGFQARGESGVGEVYGGGPRSTERYRSRRPLRSGISRSCLLKAAC